MIKACRQHFELFARYEKFLCSKWHGPCDSTYLLLGNIDSFLHLLRHLLVLDLWSPGRSMTGRFLLRFGTCETATAVVGLHCSLCFADTLVACLRASVNSNIQVIYSIYIYIYIYISFISC